LSEFVLCPVVGSEFFKKTSNSVAFQLS